MEADWDQIRKTYAAWQLAQERHRAEWDRIIKTHEDVPIEVLERLAAEKIAAERVFMEAARPLLRPRT